MHRSLTSAAFAPQWPLVLARGAVLVALALAALLWPDESLSAFMLLAAAAAAVGGALGVAEAVRLRRRADVWWLVGLQGAVGVALAAVVVAFPVAPVTLLAAAVACWAGLLGVTLLLEARELRRDAVLGWASGFGGAVSVTAAALVVLYATRLTLVPVLYGLVAFALAWGVLEIVVALRLRAIGARPRAA